jgi:hypothetical protein
VKILTKIKKHGIYYLEGMFKMDHIELQEKILEFNRIIEEEELLKNTAIKVIDRREIINIFGYGVSCKKNKEVIGNLSTAKNEDEKIKIVFDYIDNCNDDEFLRNLIELLFDRFKKLKIYFNYDGIDNDEDEEVDPDGGGFYD